MKIAFCSYLGIVGSAISYLFGGWSEAITTLLIFMIIDYIMGLVVAGVYSKSPKSESGKLESRAGWKGLMKKCVTLLFIIIANRLDLQLHTTYIKDGVCIAFIVNELISIVENGGLMGIPIPKIISKSIDLLNKEGDANE